MTDLEMKLQFLTDVHDFVVAFEKRSPHFEGPSGRFLVTLTDPDDREVIGGGDSIASALDNVLVRYDEIPGGVSLLGGTECLDFDHLRRA